MNLTTSTPAEIDTALAAVYVRGYAANAAKAIAKARRDNMRDGVEKAEQGDNRYRGWTRDALAECQVKVDAAIAECAAVWAETVPFDAEFDRRGGWTRAFLVVTSGKGHIHRSMTCSTCYVTTEFAWLPEMSGSDEPAIVTAAGADACTVCYPTAPVETAGPRTVFSAAEKVTAAERQAKSDERAIKAAAKAAKAITDVDGSPLRGKWGVIATERTAQIEYVDAATDAQTVVSWARDDEHRAHLTGLAAEYAAVADRILAALAAKRGTTVDEQRAALAPKVAKKVREYA